MPWIKGGSLGGLTGVRKRVKGLKMCHLDRCRQALREGFRADWGWGWGADGAQASAAQPTLQAAPPYRPDSWLSLTGYAGARWLRLLPAARKTAAINGVEASAAGQPRATWSVWEQYLGRRDACEVVKCISSHLPCSSLFSPPPLLPPSSPKDFPQGFWPVRPRQ